MRSIVGLLVLAVVTGIVFLAVPNGNGKGKDGGGNDGGPGALAFDAFPYEGPIPFARGTVKGFQLIVPRDWVQSDKPITPLANEGVAVRGAMEDGFMPAILFYPVLSRKRSLEEFTRDERTKLTASGDPAEILADAPAVVGGMAAHRLVYTRTVRGGIQVRTIDFYFVGPKGIGMLRMLSNSTTFMKWRPVFEQVAAALRRQ